jgi:serine/threonine-protein kinase
MSGDRSFVKLLDFGIARATQDAEQGRLTQTGGVIGTAHYMSPEQLFEGKQVDHRSDVWALGVVTYRMLTGRLPFDGNTYGDLCLAVNQGVFTPASSVAALPPELDLFLARALATNRNQRFASVKEFAAEFTAFVQRQSGMSNLPVLPGSASGAVAPTIGSRPATSGTQQLQTEAVASVTLQDVPMRRSGPALMGAILGVVLIGAVAVAAFKVWSSGGVMEADPPAKGNHTVAARAAASSLLPPAAGAKTPHKSSASEVDASNLEADVKASDLSGARDVKVEPAGVEPAGKQRQAPLAPAKQAISRRAVGTPATPSKLAKSPSTHHASAPESSGTKPSPPSVPQEKYRGF